MFHEDLDLFFTDFAQTVTIDLGGGQSRNIQAIFDNAFFNPQAGEMEMDTTLPRFLCKYSDVEDVLRESLVTIASLQYSIIEIQPDGTGIATVILAHES